MSTPDNIEIRWLQKDKLEERLPELISIEQRGALDKWDEDSFRKKIDFNHSHIRMAEIDGQMVGYVAYEIHDKHFQILKLEIDPEFKNRGVENKLIEDMLGKLPNSEKEQIVFLVHEDALSLLTLLSTKYNFKIDKAELEKKKYFKDGKSAYVMRHATAKLVEYPQLGSMTISSDGFNSGSNTNNSGLPLNFEPMIVSTGMPVIQSPDMGITPEDSNDNETSTPAYNPPSKAELLRRMCLRLQEITGGLEWQIVKPNNRGQLEPTSVPDNLKTAEGLSFRTSSKVKHPEAVKAALCEFFSQKPTKSHTGELDKAAKVDFPASWVRPIHLTWEPRSSFVKQFVPSDYQARPGKDDKRQMGG